MPYESSDTLADLGATYVGTGICDRADVALPDARQLVDLMTRNLAGFVSGVGVQSKALVRPLPATIGPRHETPIS
jgi:hypothetical protein